MDGRKSPARSVSGTNAPMPSASVNCPAKQRNAVSLQSLTAFHRAVAMHLVHILLPSADNIGRPFGREDFDLVKEDLASCFESVTAYLQAPAEGQWQDDE
ncbi:hypothetical protein [Mesorhizobium sp.]|uniref:hypothetical protein n=2 Tax=Mesorhizobium TaxID=68287 RepID=UPI00257EFFA7|nr:hypothetical protein [Mesorhizobium sp.]